MFQRWIATAARATGTAMRMTFAPLTSALERVAVAVDPFVSFAVDVVTGALSVAVETITTVAEIKRGKKSDQNI